MAFGDLTKSSHSKYARVFSYAHDTKQEGVSKWIADNKGLEKTYELAIKHFNGQQDEELVALKNKHVMEQASLKISRKNPVAKFEIDEVPDSFMLGLIEVKGGEATVVELFPSCEGCG